MRLGHGGEVFVIVMPGCDLALATARAEQIRSQVAATPIHVPEGLINMTCSVGVTATSGPRRLRLVRTSARR
jgi:PleD family two-component response regulator